MSGTSLDGIDLALCNFTKENDGWKYHIDDAITVEYDNEWRNRLENAYKLDSFRFIKLHNEYGQFIGKSINSFIKNKKIKIDLIASHGHTIFHKPDEGLTFQIGNGLYIAVTTNTITISDFRSTDIAYGGQGAPLVPTGDSILFSQYDACLNLGGFSNISFRYNNKIFAFDICPVNIAINYLMKEKFLLYDNNGENARKGIIDKSLLNKLENIKYYKKPYPKSLSREWLESEFIPFINESTISLENKLRTLYEHIANQITFVLNKINITTVLFTGGGVYNKFLMELIKNKINTKTRIIVPDKYTIEYKEALIFAFLGLLRYHNEVNCYASVTGASKDTIGGIIYLP
jgi:anhydro-N-acetylmuramic acid kinase